jgi:hypothetical protein
MYPENSSKRESFIDNKWSLKQKNSLKAAITVNDLFLELFTNKVDAVNFPSIAFNV